jgi:hypothetical protein
MLDDKEWVDGRTAMSTNKRQFAGRQLEHQRLALLVVEPIPKLDGS